MDRKTFDHERITFNLARLRKGGKTFEIAIDPDLAISYKHGADVDISEIVKSEHIFSDVKKGELASETDLRNIFGTEKPLEVAEIIIKEGEIQLTAEYRKKVREEKLNKIIYLIHRNAVDPKTNLPHPPDRIQSAIKEAKVRIDEFKKAEDQVQDVLKNIREIIPIKLEVKKLQVVIPAEYAAKSYSTVKRFGKMLKEQWNNDGSLTAVIEVPGGMESNFYDKLNSLTHGNNEVKVLNTM
ncbi:ribosome assembly factor SBDS [Candidatus Woesearchaeota archaeon]|nr:MAG: ribosome assembly factor SBDS [Candidatus Woesearchaeota archaeon]